jgi:MFS family permease
MRAVSTTLRQYNYRLWAGADVVSVTGTWMQVLGVNWYVLATTGSATRMGLGIVLQALPVLLIGPYAGTLVDRIAPRPLLIRTQLAHALLAVALAAVALGHRGVWPVYLVAVLSGVVSSVDGPALGRFGTMVLGSALALGSLINSTGRIVGMSLGGVLVAAAGPAVLFGANAVSFLVVVGALVAMRPAEWHPLASAAKTRRGVRDGFRYLLGQPVILVVLAVSLVLGSLGRNYQVTMAAMSSGPLHSGAAGYGLLSAVFAAGTVLGALVATLLRRLGFGLLIAAGAVGSAAQVAVGLMPSVMSFATVLVPIACAAVLIDTTVSVRVQTDTREDMRGRVVAAMAVVSSLAGLIGAPALGWLCEHTGPRTALVFAGTVGLIGCTAGGAALVRLTASSRRRARLLVA